MKLTKTLREKLLDFQKRKANIKNIWNKYNLKTLWQTKKTK